VICASVDKAQIGMRMLWMRCGLAFDHAGKHWDIKRDYRWEGPLIWDGDFERTGVAGELKRLRKVCRKCLKATCECEIITPYQDWKGQVDMFRKQRDMAMVLLEEDIASWEEYHFPPYTGEF